MFTPSLTQHDVSVVDFNSTHVYLLGDLERNRIKEIFTSNPLVIRLHDRDTKRDSILEKMETRVQEQGLNVFEADSEFCNELTKLKREAPDRSPFGTVELRLEELLNRAPERANALARTKFLNCKKMKKTSKTKERFQTDPSDTFPDDDSTPTTKEEEKVAEEDDVDDDDDDLTSDSITPIIRFRASVIPHKRRKNLSAQEKEEMWDLSEAQRIVRRPGGYISTNTQLDVVIKMARPIDADVTPQESVSGAVFERAAFLIPYDEPDILIKLRSVR